MASDIRLNDNAVVVDGNVGIGTSNPARPLHVEGSEIHSGGTGAGFSFADRKKAFVNSPQQGERWVWYAQDGQARLWSGQDLLTISEINGLLTSNHFQAKTGSFTESFGATIDELKGKNNQIRLKAASITLNHPNAPTVVVVPDDTQLVANGGGSARSVGNPLPPPSPGPKPDLPPTVNVPPRIAMFHDYGNGKDGLVLNHEGRYPDGVRIEGDVHVVGVLTQASSIALKEGVSALSVQEAMQALLGLRPVTFRYVADAKKQQHAGFIAEETPELVAKANHKAVGPMDIVAVLTAVVQDQQRTIAELAEKIESLAQRTLNKSKSGG